MADQDQALDQSLQGLQKLEGVPSVPGMPGAQGVAGLPTMSPEMLAKLEAFTQQPALKKYVALASNPEFLGDLTNVIQHPDLKTCGQWELGWMVFMFIFRTWCLSKTTHWIKSLFVSLFTILLFWAVAAIVIPSYFLNPAFMKLVKDTWRILT